MKFTLEPMVNKKKCVAVAVIIKNDIKKNRTIIYYTDEVGFDDCFDEYFVDTKIETIFPIPYLTKDQRIMTSISGASGSGKSVFSSKLIDEIYKIDRNIKGTAIFSAATEPDPAFAKLKNIFRIDMEESMQTAQITDVRNMICLFDDFGHHRNKYVNAWVHDFLSQLLERSRKLNTHLIVVSHVQRAGHKTRLINLESQSFVVFPSNLSETTKLLKDYLAFNKKQLEYALDIGKKNGRFAYIYINRMPNYLVSQDRIIFVSSIQKKMS
jgi:adenylate kinase family enzyme